MSLVFKCIVKSSSHRKEDYKVFFNDKVDDFNSIVKDNEKYLGNVKEIYDNAGDLWVPMEGKLKNKEYSDNPVDWEIGISTFFDDYDYTICTPRWFCFDIAEEVILETLGVLLKKDRYKYEIYQDLKLDNSFKTLPSFWKVIHGNLNLEKSEVTKINSGFKVEGDLFLNKNFDDSCLDYVPVEGEIKKRNPEYLARFFVSSCGGFSNSKNKIKIKVEPEYLLFKNNKWVKNYKEIIIPEDHKCFYEGNYQILEFLPNEEKETKNQKL